MPYPKKLLKCVLILICLAPAFRAYGDETPDTGDSSEGIRSVYSGWKGEHEFEEANKYLYGIDREIDEDKGTKLLREAADLEYPPALNALGLARFFGKHGLWKMKRRGIGWLELGSELGDPYCAMNLAELYLDEKLYKLDLSLAEKYLKMVRASDETYQVPEENTEENYNYSHLRAAALYKLGLVYQQKAKSPSENETQEALEVIAFNYFNEAINEGNQEAYHNLSSIYAFGIGTERNIEKANDCLQQFANYTQRKIDDQWYTIKARNLIDDFDVYELELETQKTIDATIRATHNQFADTIANGELDEDIPIEDAIKWYELAAESGNEWAMLKLAFIYWEGEKLSKNESLAFKWFEQAGTQGHHTLGYHNTGVLYRLGIGVAKNEEKALEYFKKANKAPFYPSYLAIKDPQQGRQILTYDEALEICKKGAKKLKDPFAQYAFARRMDMGWGVKQDVKQAHRYYKKAAKKGIPEAQYEYGNNFTYPFFGEKYKKAEKWLKKAAENGSAKAHYKLADLYYDKIIKIENRYKAIAYHTQECLKLNPEHSRSLTRLGWLYFNGICMEQSVSKAEELFKKAADQKLPWAMNSLAYLYEKTKQYDKAYQWYVNAAEEGYTSAMLEVADWTANGYHIEKNPSEAAYYYRKAALKGNKKAIKKVCYAYIYGLGMEQNLDLALRWINIALNNQVDLDITLIARVLLEKRHFENAKSILKDAQHYSTEIGDAMVNYLYYRLFIDSNYTKRNEKKALKYLEKSYEGNYPPAQLEKGKIAFDAKQWSNALSLFKETENNQEFPTNKYTKDAQAEASFNIGCMLIQGLSCSKDVNMGLMHIKKAADYGLPKACYAYGISHFQKMASAPRREEAIQYIKDASIMGYKPAIEFIKKLKKEEKKAEPPKPTLGRQNLA